MQIGISHFKYFLFLLGGGAHATSVPVEVRGQFAEVGSLFAPRGCQKLNSGSQTWWQGPLSTEPLPQMRNLCKSAPKGIDSYWAGGHTKPRIAL